MSLRADVDPEPADTIPSVSDAPPTKLFVLDTNVLLFDHTSIYNFEEHDIVLPIVVLEELDTFKKGHDLINLEAREFVRELDRLSTRGTFREGLPLGEERGRLFVEVGRPRSQLVDDSFPTDRVDHRILAVADQMRQRFPGRHVCVVTKDINLRMKAKSLGLPAADYETGKISHLDAIQATARFHEGCSCETIDTIHDGLEGVPVDALGLPETHQVQYHVFRNGSRSVLARTDPRDLRVYRVQRAKAYGIVPRNAEQTFALDALLDPHIELVAITGKAGTGKTLLALAAALEQRKTYRQVYLARPVVPMGNRGIGYLPGDVQSKLDPYMQPLWDNLSVIKHRFPPGSKDHERIGTMIETEKITIAPLAYIRGRSLESVFFITDEAQNLTPHEVKTIITRAGAGTKMVFTGDLRQIDTPYLDSQSNGLAYLVDRMRGQSLFAHVHLEKGERSHLAELASDLL
ncbi:MAG: PhoH family protein [Planctomycetes bacterium]|nr:PhoH family protein [Planctomycetota bacterium]